MHCVYVQTDVALLSMGGMVTPPPRDGAEVVQGQILGRKEHVFRCSEKEGCLVPQTLTTHSQNMSSYILQNIKCQVQ